MTDEWEGLLYTGVERMRAAAELMQELVKELDVSLFDRCDCGHMQIAHQLPRYSQDGRFPCGHPGCGCEHFIADTFENPSVGNPLRAGARMRRLRRSA